VIVSPARVRRGQIRDNGTVRRIAIIGGGPAGYEAAQVAAELGAEVSLIEADGIGGACVLYDCVPSKTLIATSEKVTAFRDAPAVGLSLPATGDTPVRLAVVNERVRQLAANQSADIARRLDKHGVRVLSGRACFAPDQPGRTFALDVSAAGERSPYERIEADAVLVATGGTPRVLPGAEPDGERILSWRQLYDLT
jgi:pyruvate/2-oxoglutarate dehydrogenase complex dihydrolipoamide dehydrogenase (E3) component